MPAIKKCYYEVLGVERTVGDDEIKKNFRRLALQLHPDKNPDRLDEAKEEFQTLQQAYEVLSNPQERAWYDEHRLSVLKGEDTELDEDIIDLFPFMTSTCYKGFGDDDEGFYTVYRKVFESITALEMEAGLEDSDEEIPSFGDSLSDYEDVVGPFYAFWESYCTRQTFGWMDEFDTRQAEHRRIARLMDKENEKVRRAHRQAWNQKVRALVDFVKRKDKRAIAWKAEQERIQKEKEEAMKKKQAELKASRAKERQKLYEQVKHSKEKHVEENKDKLQELESFLADEFQDKDYVDDSEEDDDMEYCHVCSKSFRTKKALANHEKSKKHLQMLEKFAAENNIATSESDEDAADIEDAADSTDNIPEQASQEDEEDSPLAQLPTRTRDETDQVLDGSEEDEDQLVSNFKQSLNLSQSTKTPKKSKKKPAARKATFSESSDAGQPILPSTRIPPTTVSKDDDSDSDFSTKKTKTAKEKKRRRANKAAPSTAPAATSNADAPEIDEPTVAAPPQTSTDLPDKEVKLPYVCGRCKAGFDSRSKLFKHIEKTGHALPPDAVPSAGEKPIKGKKGKRR